MLQTIAILLSIFSMSVRPKHSLEAEQFLLQTKDGAAVCLRHYQGNGEPVLISHGISSNLNFWDMRPDRSLAKHLHQQGYDVWLTSFRGHDCAKKDIAGKAQRNGWSIDDYGYYDLDTAIDHILQQSEHPRLHFIAHSLGGMALMAYMSKHGDRYLASVGLAGTPGDFSGHDAALKLAIQLSPISPPTVPTDHLAKLAGILPITPLDNLIYSETHRTFEDHREMLSSVAGPMSRGEILHLRQTLLLGYFAPYGSTTPYFETTEKATVPLLLIAGRADHISPVDRVYPFYQKWGGPKEFVIAGKEYGYASDYGHCDLSMGTMAPTDIYPLFDALIQANPIH